MRRNITTLGCAFWLGLLAACGSDEASVAASDAGNPTDGAAPSDASIERDGDVECCPIDTVPTCNGMRTGGATINGCHVVYDNVPAPGHWKTTIDEYGCPLLATDKWESCLPDFPGPDEDAGDGGEDGDADADDGGDAGEDGADDGPDASDDDAGPEDG